MLAGDAEAKLELALMLVRLAGIEFPVKERQTGMVWLEELAESGHAEAMFALGREYFYAEGNPEKGLYWWEKAVASDSHEAALELHYVWSEEYPGFQTDPEQAAEYARRYVSTMKDKAEQADTEALQLLAEAYFYGSPVVNGKSNYSAAFQYALRGTAQDNPVCALLVARMYALGRGTDEDLSKADEWYDKAAIYLPDEVAFFRARPEATEAEWLKHLQDQALRNFEDDTE